MVVCTCQVLVLGKLIYAGDARPESSASLRSVLYHQVLNLWVTFALTEVSERHCLLLLRHLPLFP